MEIGSKPRLLVNWYTLNIEIRLSVQKIRKIDLTLIEIYFSIDLDRNCGRSLSVQIIRKIVLILFIIRVYKNISYFMLRLHYNIGKIIHKNVNNIFYIQNFGNFKTDFFLNLYLQVFLVKQVSSKNCSFYGLPLWHLHWISGLYSASNSHNFCIVV